MNMQTLNEVISYVIQLYMHKTGNLSNDAPITALVVMNARMLKGRFQTVGDMLKANIWGNQFSFLHIMLPSTRDLKNIDPIDFIIKAKDEMRRRRNSLALYLTRRILAIFKTIKEPEGAARHLYSIWNNTSITMSSLVGPSQKMVMAAGLPVNSFYFTLAGVPQSMLFTIVSYMGKLRVVVRMEKSFINCRQFVSCMNEAFENIRESASAKATLKKSD